MIESSGDLRRIPARHDLAAWRLRGKVEAKRYVRGQDHAVCVHVASIYADADRSGAVLTQALFGETFTVYDSFEGFAWGQLATDDYVGWIDSSCLRSGGVVPTHRVSALSSHVYERSDIKSQVVMSLPINARLEVTGEYDRWCQTSDGWVWARHLDPVGAVVEDWVGVAGRLVGVPYLWAGRSAAGIDCSALVQLALLFAGVRAPRDSDMQYGELGFALEDDQSLRRGDLVFWSGHVGIMISATDLIHANAHHMAVVVEPLRTAMDRIGSGFGPVIGLRRVDVRYESV